MRLFAAMVFVLGATACGGGADLGACPNDPVRQNAGAALIASRCAICHNSNFTGAQRQAAPASVNYDTTAGILASDSSGYSTIQSGSMPRGSARLTAEETESVRIFLACGAVRGSTTTQ